MKGMNNICSINQKWVREPSLDPDLNAVAGFVMGRETPGFYRSLSDLNGDNKVDAADVVKLIDILSQPRQEK